MGVSQMKQKQHLIAIDLDGTLLSDTKEISLVNQTIIKQIIEAGHIIVIATGRPHRSSIHFYHKLGLTTPMVNFNGALVHHPTNQKWGAFHHPLQHKTALEVVDASLQTNAKNIMVEVLDNAYLERHDQEIIDIFHLPMERERQHPFIIGNIKEKLIDDPTSILIRPEDESLVQLKTHLEDYVEFIEHRNWGAPYNIIEITKKGINKAVGLKQIANYYHIPRERIIAFGDESNDLEMIDFAGVGVVMDNGISELKSIANYVTHSNELDGVGAFLSDYFKVSKSIIY